jgi:hypothetical protein
MYSTRQEIGTRRSIALFRKPRLWTPSSVNRIQFQPYTLFKIYFNIIFVSMTCMTSYLGVTDIFWWISYLPHLCCCPFQLNLIMLSIPDEVISFFNWPNPSSRNMALGSTQPPTEMSTRNLPGDKGRPAHKASSPSVSRLSRKRLTILWASKDCHRDSFTLLSYNLLQ